MVFPSGFACFHLLGNSSPTLSESEVRSEGRTSGGRWRRGMWIRDRRAPPARREAVMVVVDVIPPREGASLRCAVAPADLDEGDAPHVDHFRAAGAPTAT